MEAYFDNSATTRCFEEVKDIVVKTMMEDFGNPSAMHQKGVDAEGYVKESARILAQILKVTEKRNPVHFRWNRVKQPGSDRWCACQQTKR